MQSRTGKNLRKRIRDRDAEMRRSPECVALGGALTVAKN